jgi:negative regulator of sigma E activity
MATNHASTIDELHHYLGQLRIDIAIGVDRRHLKAGSRLCWLLVDKLDRDGATLDQVAFKALQIQLLDLQRAIDSRAEEANPSPVAKRVGKMRVLSHQEGGAKREPKGVVKALPRLRLVEP